MNLHTWDPAKLLVEGQFDPATWTVSYLVADAASRRCALIDSVLDFDFKSGRVSHHSAERLAERVRQLGLTVDWILETHVHADHLSAARWLRDRLGGRIAISRQVGSVQQVFGELFNLGPEFARDGRQFDRLFDDDDDFVIGALRGRVILTPGHTPACAAYLIDDPRTPAQPAACFVGDTLFMPDYGTARCDFPGGDARTLYRSINRVLSLPPSTVLYMCHDYQPGGRAACWTTTVADERAHNLHVRDGISEDEFVAMRQARDATLGMPVLLLPAVQVNMRAGELPAPESNGRRYLRIPLDAF